MYKTISYTDAKGWCIGPVHVCFGAPSEIQVAKVSSMNIFLIIELSSALVPCLRHAARVVYLLVLTFCALFNFEREDQTAW